jgi:uncharacterized protein YhbP (UPF0306 family)
VAARPASDRAGAGQDGARDGAAAGSPDGAQDLRERVARYLRAHHTMTVATIGPPAGAAPEGAAPKAGRDGSPTATLAPHAASVFYAVDDSLRLVFLSNAASTHGLHIGAAGLVAVTVTEQYDDWELIQGVQLWGIGNRVTGAAKVAAMAAYLRRFPFVKELMEQPRLAGSMRKVAVYRVTPERVAFTDNTTGVFGREVLDLKG